MKIIAYIFKTCKVIVILICFLFIHTWSGYAQESRENQLITNLEKAETDSVKIDILIQLCDLTTYVDGDKAIKYFHQLRDLAVESKNYLALARSYERAGNIYLHQGEKEKARDSYLKAYEINESKVGDYEISASIMYNLGNLYYELGNPDSAIYYADRAGEIFLENNDSMGYGASLYLTVGVYRDLGDLDRAMKNGLEALRIFQRIGNKNWEMYMLNNLVDLYNVQGQYVKSLEILKKVTASYRANENDKFLSVALRFTGDIYMELDKDSLSRINLEEALRIARSGGFAPEEVRSLFSLALLNFRIEDYQTALSQFEEGLNKSRNISDGKFIASNLLGMGQSAYELNNYNFAITQLDNALNLFIELDDPQRISETYEYLSKAHEAIGNYQKSLAFFKIYSTYNDSLLNEEKSKELAELTQQYEFEQKEQQISTLQKENKLAEANRRNLWLILILTSVVAVSVISLLYIRSRKNRQLLRKEKEVDKLKSRFFANISHEFRTPLTLILSPLYELRKKPELEEHKPILAIIERNARRLLNLVNQILELSRLEAGKRQTKYVRKNISIFLNKVFISFHSLAESRNINLEKDLHQLETDFIFDEENLETILNNLLGNAIKYEPENGKVRMEASLTDIRGKRFLNLYIYNYGSFIPKNIIEHLFDRFYQGNIDENERPENPGSGIGLALTREITHMLNGKITVSSDKEKGTWFEINIPEGDKIDKTSKADYEILTETNYSEEGIQAMRNKSHQNEESDSRLRILVIEDHKEVRDFILSCVQDKYAAYSASNGAEGVEIAESLVPDIIVSDVMMPGMDGYELCRHLKTDERTSHIPLILLSARASDESRMEGLKSLADDYLVKPFNPNELLIRIENLLELRSRLQKKFSSALPGEISVSGISSVDRRFIDKATAAVEKNLSNEDFGVEQLGREIGMSRSQLHRKLTAITGNSTSFFIRNYRLQRAYELVKNNAASISEIAYMTGFSNPSYFSRCFREVYNTTPGEVKAG